jgi:hypothetical protein
MAHTCNPSYSEGRDQEDHISKPAWVNSSWDPIWKKNPSQERAGTVAQGEGPEFKPLHLKKKKSVEIRPMIGWDEQGQEFKVFVWKPYWSLNSGQCRYVCFSAC